jgi:hypothetical protein
MFTVAGWHFGGYLAQKVPMESNDFSDPSRMLTAMASL